MRNAGRIDASIEGTPEAELWFGHREQERMSARNLADAYKERLAYYHCRADMPLLLVFTVYERESVGTVLYFDVLDNLIERLEEDYGDWEGSRNAATEAMREAEREFVAVVQREYKPFTLESIGELCCLDVQPTQECCTFVTGCCVQQQRQPYCALHKADAWYAEYGRLE